MELTPVESSHIAAIGYLEADRVLLVRYKDGGLYSFVGVTPAAHEALMQSPSHGAFLHQWRDIGTLITKGVMPTEPTGSRGVPVAEPGGNEAPSPGPLNVIDENAGKCCRKIFDGAALRGGENWSSAAGIVTCGTCGAEFRREMVGPVAHWRIVEHFAVVRPR